MLAFNSRNGQLWVKGWAFSACTAGRKGLEFGCWFEGYSLPALLLNSLYPDWEVAKRLFRGESLGFRERLRDIGFGGSGFRVSQP